MNTETPYSRSTARSVVLPHSLVYCKILADAETPELPFAHYHHLPYLDEIFKWSYWLPISGLEPQKPVAIVGTVPK